IAVNAGRRLIFFSSRRRHTRFSRDWSSDVCSSDLAELEAQDVVEQRRFAHIGTAHDGYRAATEIAMTVHASFSISVSHTPAVLRSEERRVGKEWRLEVAPSDGIRTGSDR